MKDKIINIRKKIIFLILFSIFIISSVNGLGCCYNPSDGLCSQNTEESSCDSPAVFYESSSCSITKCEEGCCVLGDSTSYTTSKACEILADGYGFEYDFQTIDEESCTDLGKSTETGACVSENEDNYNNDCSFTTRSKCSTGNFYVNLTCTDSSLKTKCKNTTKTMCYNDDVYYKDSCGNADKLKSNCDYDSGTTCTLASNKKDYYCKSLNCVTDEGVTKLNGDSWCVGSMGWEYDSTGYISEDAENSGAMINGMPEEKKPPVGSRYFRKYCLNGEIEIEPCADYRAEVCKIYGGNESGSTCEANNWQDCLTAGNDSESCDSEYCFFYTIGARFSTDFLEDEGLGSANEELVEEILDDLEADKCVPIVGGGLDMSSSSSTSSSETEAQTCSYGSYVAPSLKFGYHGGSEWIIDYDSDELIEDLLAPTTRPNYLLPGINWDKESVNEWWFYPASGTNYGALAIIKDFLYGISKSAPGKPWEINKYFHGWSNNIIEDARKGGFEKPYYTEAALKEICDLTADCSSTSTKVKKSGGTDRDPTFSYSFTCKNFVPPSGGSQCDECGKNDLPCSEYECESLGKKCEFTEPEDSDKAYCTSSTDTTAPSITSLTMNPESPVEPYTAVTFKINTSETSECKFNLNNAGSLYENMTYDFGSGYDDSHEVILSMPNQNISEDGEVLYDVLTGSTTKNTQYTMYVRCIDVQGNGEASSPTSLKFEVEKTPDTIPPVIKSFSPISPAYAIFNSTTKSISFNLNEPAECRWSQTDIDFDKMVKVFTCDESLRVVVGNSSYSCSGTLNNVTTNPDSQSKYYIRCKDQPWLEGAETEDYSRNENKNSKEYIIKPSKELKVSEISPVGTIKKAESSMKIELKATTSGGSSSGVSECKWKLTNNSLISGSSLVKFNSTNSASHRQTITSPYEGENYGQIRCSDSAGNLVYSNFSFNLTGALILLK
jgi:hypothetical protein